MERELKLELLDGEVERLIHIPLVSDSSMEPPRSGRLISTYFDTPEMALRREHVSLRVRGEGGHYVQTLERCSVRGGALYDREEYEIPTPRDVPDLLALREKVQEGSALGMLLREDDLAGRLSPVFVTDIVRTVVLLRLPQGDEIELAVDSGEVRATDATAPVRELKMEIKAGTPDHLFAFALQLLDAVSMRLTRASSGDHGYALLADEPNAVVRARALELADGDSAQEAFLRITRNCLAQIVGNECEVVNGINPESVHQMRVGLRRLRSAIDVFRPLLACPPELYAELKWIADELGPARDWEVLAHTTLRDAFSEAPEDVGADEVVAAAKAIAATGRQRAARAVNSERYTRLILTLSHWLSGASWRYSADDAQRTQLADPAGRFARTTLHLRQRRLLKRGRGMAKADERRRHRARIAAKKLRYALEFFESLFPGGKVARYREQLSRLQDDLGWRNDMAVAEALLRSLGTDQQPLAIGCGYARGNIARRVSADKEVLRRLWKKFKSASLPV